MSIIHGAHSAGTLNKWLLKSYGKNPFGKPMFRVCVADDCYEKVGGEHMIWPEGSKVEDRGAIMTGREAAEFLDGWRDTSSIPLLSKPKVLPLRIETGLREVKKYPNVNGWILERWFPAELYGSQELWEACPELGPYPSQGDYEFISGGCPEPPTLSQLETLVAQFFSNRNKLTGTPEQRIRAKTERALAEMEEEERKFREYAQYAIKDAGSPFRSYSREGGRLRTKIADKLGISEHVGN